MILVETGIIFRQNTAPAATRPSWWESASSAADRDSCGAHPGGPGARRAPPPPHGARSATPGSAWCRGLAASLREPMLSGEWRGAARPIEARPPSAPALQPQRPDTFPQSGPPDPTAPSGSASPIRCWSATRLLERDPSEKKFGSCASIFYRAVASRMERRDFAPSMKHDLTDLESRRVMCEAGGASARLSSTLSPDV